MKNILVVFALIGGLVFTGWINIAYAEPSILEVPHSDTSSNKGVPSLTGKVIETMDSGGYTYINLEQDGKSTWAAVPTTKITVGQEISVQPGFVMNDFKSKTLDRTFGTIVFSSGIVGGAENKAVVPAPSSEVMPQDSTHGVKSPDKKTEVIKVEKAEGPNAYTVAELFAKRAELDTKSIVLKGKVVKVGKAIMGKNWIHIQDGSGSASDKTNDIIVTSQDVPEVGAVVTVKGTLYKDKDFGMGYFFNVIIEEGTIK